MDIFHGKGVYGAIAIGRAAVLKRQETAVRRQTADPAAERARLADAKARAAAQLAAICEQALETVGEEEAAIFEIHQMMLEDDDLCTRMDELIETEQVNAEYAVATAGEEVAAMFAAMDDASARTSRSAISASKRRPIPRSGCGRSGSAWRVLISSGRSCARSTAPRSAESSGSCSR